MTNQQSLRYKFVADKYCSLIEKQYKDCSNSTINHILQVFPAVAEQQKNEASDEKMEQTHPPTKKEEIPSHPNIQCGYRSNTAEPQNSGGEDLIRIRTAAVKVRPNTTYFGDYTSAQTLQHGWIQQQNFTSKLKRHSLAQVPLYASDGADYYLRTTPQRGNNFIQGRTTLNGAANNGLGLGLTQQTAYEPGTGFGSG